MLCQIETMGQEKCRNFPQHVERKAALSNTRNRAMNVSCGQELCTAPVHKV